MLSEELDRIEALSVRVAELDRECRASMATIAEERARVAELAEHVDKLVALNVDSLARAENAAAELARRDTLASEGMETTADERERWLSHTGAVSRLVRDIARLSARLATATGRGAEAERARIVAWLRAIHGTPVPNTVTPQFASAYYAKTFAAAIESGKHTEAHDG